MAKATKGQYKLVKGIDDLVPILEKYRDILDSGNSNVITQFSYFLYWYYFPKPLNIFIPNLFLAYKEMANTDYPLHPYHDYGMDGGPAKDALKTYFDEVNDKNLKSELESKLGNLFIKFGKNFNPNKIYILKLKDCYKDKFKHIQPFIINNTQNDLNGKNQIDNNKVQDKAILQFNPPDKYIIRTKVFILMLPVLVKYISDILQKEENNSDWWQKFIIKRDVLPENVTRNFPENGTTEECINELDISACLKIIISHWKIFSKKMKKVKLSWIHELLEIRNEEAHPTIEKLTSYSDDDIYHTLDTMELCMRPISENLTDEISKIKKSFENEYIKG
jgi:hypothetical protein